MASVITLKKCYFTSLCLSNCDVCRIKVCLYGILVLLSEKAARPYIPGRIHTIEPFSSGAYSYFPSTLSSFVVGMSTNSDISKPQAACYRNQRRFSDANPMLAFGVRRKNRC